jgi:carbon-monoxide dehydrogenase large subunit
MTRREDHRLLTGAGTYTADREPPGALAAVFVRSDHAHARIVDVDAVAARAMPGVVAVFVGADLVAAAPFRVQVATDGVTIPLRAPPRPLLAQGRTVFVGEAVALVIAATEASARDAADAVVVTYEALPAVTDPVVAAASGAPQIHPEVPGNVCFAQSHGDAAATEAALADADHVVRLVLVNNRVVPGPLEPRAVVATHDGSAEGVFHLSLPTQGMPRMREELAELLGVPADRVRLRTDDVGGGFGVRTPAYPETVALALAARALGRSIRWVATRSESFLAEHHARDGCLEGELGVDADGTFRAMRFRFTANAGAHLTFKGVFIASTNPGRTMAGCYRTPALHLTVHCVVTNTPVIGPYRGSGRPEIACLVERLVDEAAAVIGMDRIALRERNLVDRLPHRTPAGVVYGSGDPVGLLATARRVADWDGFAARRAASRARGRLRGIGIALFVEATGGPPREAAALRVRDGGIEVHVGTQSTGQGHETVFPAVVARHLGVPIDRVRLVQGDADVAVDSGATIASRSLVAAGGAAVTAADALLAKARDLAARRFECAASDLDFAAGAFRVQGTDRAVALVSLLEVAPQGATHPLDSDVMFSVPPTFPQGCHVCEVEVDPETGVVEVARYCAVDDVGEVQDAVIVAGQIHGGVAQGIGQALLEHHVFDAFGQPRTASFLDYAIPRADDLPFVTLGEHATREPAHPLGSRGAGEAGATGAPGAVMNAIVDALRERGVTHLDMPATPQSVWRSLRRTHPVR